MDSLKKTWAEFRSLPIWGQLAIGLGAVVVVAALAGGSGESSDSGGGDEPSADVVAAREAREAQEEQQTLQAAALLDCEGEVAPFLDSLSELNSRLSVGVQFDEYLTQIGNVRVEYDKVAADGLETTCLKKVGRPAERGLRLYSKAADEWNDCIQDFNCDVDSIGLEQTWLRAGLQVDIARAALP